MLPFRSLARHSLECQRKEQSSAAGKRSGQTVSAAPGKAASTGRMPGMMTDSRRWDRASMTLTPRKENCDADVDGSSKRRRPASSDGCIQRADVTSSDTHPAEYEVACLVEREFAPVEPPFGGASLSCESVNRHTCGRGIAMVINFGHKCEHARRAFCLGAPILVRMHAHLSAFW